MADAIAQLGSDGACGEMEGGGAGTDMEFPALIKDVIEGGAGALENIASVGLMEIVTNVSVSDAAAAAALISENEEGIDGDGSEMISAELIAELLRTNNSTLECGMILDEDGDDGSIHLQTDNNANANNIVDEAATSQSRNLNVEENLGSAGVELAAENNNLSKEEIVDLIELKTRHNEDNGKRVTGHMDQNEGEDLLGPGTSGGLLMQNVIFTEICGEEPNTPSNNSTDNVNADISGNPPTNATRSPEKSNPEELCDPDQDLRGLESPSTANSLQDSKTDKSDSDILINEEILDFQTAKEVIVSSPLKEHLLEPEEYPNSHSSVTSGNNFDGEKAKKASQEGQAQTIDDDEDGSSSSPQKTESGDECKANSSVEKGEIRSDKVGGEIISTLSLLVENAAELEVSLNSQNQQILSVTERNPTGDAVDNNSSPISSEGNDSDESFKSCTSQTAAENTAKAQPKQLNNATPAADSCITLSSDDELQVVQTISSNSKKKVVSATNVRRHSHPVVLAIPALPLRTAAARKSYPYLSTGSKQDIPLSKTELASKCNAIAGAENTLENAVSKAGSSVPQPTELPMISSLGESKSTSLVTAVVPKSSVLDATSSTIKPTKKTKSSVPVVLTDTESTATAASDQTLTNPTNSCKVPEASSQQTVIALSSISPLLPLKSKKDSDLKSSIIPNSRTVRSHSGPSESSIQQHSAEIETSFDRQQEESTNSDPSSSSDSCTPEKISTQHESTPAFMNTFKCLICGLEGFKRFMDFRVHRSFHSNLPFDEEKEKPFECGICKKPFHLRDDALVCAVLAHKPTSLRLQMFRYNCSLCPSGRLKFHTIPDLKRHWEIEHGHIFLTNEEQNPNNSSDSMQDSCSPSITTATAPKEEADFVRSRGLSQIPGVILVTERDLINLTANHDENDTQNSKLLKNGKADSKNESESTDKQHFLRGATKRSRGRPRISFGGRFKKSNDVKSKLNGLQNPAAASVGHAMICPICNSKFHSHYSLNNHMQEHTKAPRTPIIPKYKCYQCPKLFTKLPALRSHFREHLSTRPVHNLRNRSKIRRGQKYKDAVGDANASDNSNKSSTKPIKNPVGRPKGSTKSKLQKKIPGHQLKLSKSIKVGKCIKCTSCPVPKVFKYLKSFQKHQRLAHNNKFNFQSKLRRGRKSNKSIYSQKEAVNRNLSAAALHIRILNNPGFVRLCNVDKHLHKYTSSKSVEKHLQEYIFPKRESSRAKVPNDRDSSPRNSKEEPKLEQSKSSLKSLRSQFQIEDGIRKVSTRSKNTNTDKNDKQKDRSGGLVATPCSLALSFMSKSVIKKNQTPTKTPKNKLASPASAQKKVSLSSKFKPVFTSTPVINLRRLSPMKKHKNNGHSSSRTKKPRIKSSTKQVRSPAVALKSRGVKRSQNSASPLKRKTKREKKVEENEEDSETEPSMDTPYKQDKLLSSEKFETKVKKYSSTEYNNVSSRKPTKRIQRFPEKKNSHAQPVSPSSENKSSRSNSESSPEVAAVVSSGKRTRGIEDEPAAIIKKKRKKITVTSTAPSIDENRKLREKGMKSSPPTKLLRKDMAIMSPEKRCRGRPKKLKKNDSVPHQRSESDKPNYDKEKRRELRNGGSKTSDDPLQKLKAKVSTEQPKPKRRRDVDGEVAKVTKTAKRHSARLETDEESFEFEATRFPVAALKLKELRIILTRIRIDKTTLKLKPAFDSKRDKGQKDTEKKKIHNSSRQTEINKRKVKQNEEKEKPAHKKAKTEKSPSPSQKTLLRSSRSKEINGRIVRKLS